jgi:PTH1 family peptidyl-tRNA hydrolase
MLIVGLGNPGPQYERNRHNAGWMQLEKLAKLTGLSFKFEKNHKANVARGNYRGKMLTMAMPLTYMNLSGQSVVSLLNYYKYDLSELLIVYDDKDFDLGAFKIKQNGSAAGHNGIKSIISCLGTQEFPRFRIGVGPKPKEYDMANFVLQNFSKAEMEILEKVLDRGTDAIESIIVDGLDKAMNLYNRKE